MFILALVAQIYSLMLFIRFIMQWIDKDGTNQINAALKPMTEPLLEPVRPKTTFGGIDLSPIVVSVIINIVVSVLAMFIP
ncbi:MAG: YggT family protein [Roseiflexaceae bacterium]